MKAREVQGLEPQIDLCLAAQRIVSMRAEELYALAATALDQRNATALHDMRIAAKRLRYVLELVGFCLPSVAPEAETRTRQLQTLIGEIHDHDVLLTRIANSADAGAKGMRRLGERVQSRRDALFSEFTALWLTIEASGLRGRIVAATTDSPNGAALSA
jgi:CHAD domain-containing protein